MTETLDYTGFSCPQVALEDEIPELIVGYHARQLIQTLLDRHQDRLEAGAPGASSLMRAWLAGGLESNFSFDTVWSLAFGDVHALLLSQSSDDLIRATAAAALRMNQAGHAGDWEARLPARARFRFDRWLLPECDAIEVSNSSGTVAVRSQINGEWCAATFHRDGGNHWQLSTGTSIGVLPLCDPPGFRFTLSTAQSLSSSGAERLLQADAYQFDKGEVSARDEWRSTCDEALQLIGEVSPCYVTWVGRVLKDLVPLQARPSTFNSGSERFSPGVICVSDQPYRWALAEMLVHECTHQYLHIINRLGPLDDGTDERLYFSPFRNKERPIFMILVAYHAFANVLLFYRNARKQGLVPDQAIAAEMFANREGTLERQLAAIESPLINATSLTPLGRALWEPLYAELHR